MLYSSLRKNTRPTRFSYCLLTNLIQLNFPFERVVRQHIICFFLQHSTMKLPFTDSLPILWWLKTHCCWLFVTRFGWWLMRPVLGDGIRHVAWILPVGWRSPGTDSWWHPVKLPTLRKWWKLWQLTNWTGLPFWALVLPLMLKGLVQ